MLHVGHCLCAIFFGAFHDGVDDFIANSSQLLVIAATSVALNRNQIGDYVGSHTTGDNANIGCSFLVNAAITLHLGQGLGSNHHSVNALFRL